MLDPVFELNPLNGSVAQIGFRSSFPFPRTDLSYGLSDGYAKSGVAVEHRDADLDFGDLPVEVSRHQGLAEKLDAVHLALDAASAVVSAPFSPDGAAEVSRCIDCLVAGDSSGACGFPWFGVLARRDDGVGIAGGNRVVAFSSVVGPVSRDATDGLVWRDLLE